MTTKRDTSFASLAHLRDQLPVGDVAPKKERAASEKKGPARAVVRLERKHRRGKEVTIVDKLGLPATELEAWCRDLKQTLGCGGSVEDTTIVLQGDFRKRLPDILTKLGARSVTVSG